MSTGMESFHAAANAIFPIPQNSVVYNRIFRRNPEKRCAIHQPRTNLQKKGSPIPAQRSYRLYHFRNWCRPEPRTQVAFSLRKSRLAHRSKSLRVFRKCSRSRAPHPWCSLTAARVGREIATPLFPQHLPVESTRGSQLQHSPSNRRRRPPRATPLAPPDR